MATDKVEKGWTVTAVSMAILIVLIAAFVVLFIRMAGDIVHASRQSAMELAVAEKAADQLKTLLIKRMKAGEEVKEADISKLPLPQLREFMYALNAQLLIVRREYDKLMNEILDRMTEEQLKNPK